MTFDEWWKNYCELKPSDRVTYAAREAWNAGRAFFDCSKTPDDGCICRGNWRSIVSECENLFQKKFADSYGHEWTFFGVVWSENDFYYGMWRDDGKVSLLSCVGSIESHGFTLVRPNVELCIKTT